MTGCTRPRGDGGGGAAPKRSPRRSLSPLPQQLASVRVGPRVCKGQAARLEFRFGRTGNSCVVRATTMRESRRTETLSGATVRWTALPLTFSVHFLLRLLSEDSTRAPAASVPTFHRRT